MKIRLKQMERNPLAHLLRKFAERSLRHAQNALTRKGEADQLDNIRTSKRRTRREN